MNEHQETMVAGNTDSALQDGVIAGINTLRKLRTSNSRFSDDYLAMAIAQDAIDAYVTALQMAPTPVGEKVEPVAWRWRERYPMDPYLDARSVARDVWSYGPDRPSWAGTDTTSEAQPLVPASLLTALQAERDRLAAAIEQVQRVNSQMAQDWTALVGRAEVAEQALDFAARWLWDKSVTDEERLSAVKNHPTIRARARDGGANREIADG